MTFFLPRLLNSTRQYTHSYGRKSISQKLRSSTGPSKNSQYLTDSRQNDDRLEVLRTVEMETWSEAKKPGQRGVGHVYDVTSQTERGISPVGSLEQREPETVYAAPGSSQSSDTITHAVSPTKDSQSPFADKQDVV